MTVKNRGWTSFLQKLSSLWGTSTDTASISTPVEIGKREWTGEDIMELVRDTSLLGGKEKITTPKVENPISTTQSLASQCLSRMKKEVQEQTTDTKETTQHGYQINEFVLVTFLDVQGMYTTEFGTIIGKKSEEHYMIELIHQRGFAIATLKELETAGHA